VLPEVPEDLEFLVIPEDLGFPEYLEFLEYPVLPEVPEDLEFPEYLEHPEEQNFELLISLTAHQHYHNKEYNHQQSQKLLVYLQLILD
jgi:hypothetical protein